MSGQLYVEAFGKLEKDDDLVARISQDGREESFLGVFEDQAKILGWSTGWSNEIDGRPEPLWEVHEAELTSSGHSDDRIGFINVGVGFGPLVSSEPTPPPPGGKHYTKLGWHRQSWNPALVLPALIQCFYDSLSRLGKVELTGIQLFGIGFDPGADRFRSTPSWFNISPAEESNAVIAFDKGLFGGRVEPAEHLIGTSGPFRLGPMVNLPEEYSLRRIGAQWPFMMSVSPLEKGLTATLPEWSPVAIGYMLGNIINRAAKIDRTPENFVIRITRMPLALSS